MAQGRVILLELNEINFEFVEHYIAQGYLPNFGKFIGDYGYSRTSSEQQYEHLEPWIQWVTAHTGLDFADHGVFRLGDIVDHDLPQIWEQLEDRGLSVGAISPINAKFRLNNAAFFVPDPWTPTGASAPAHYCRLHRAIAQMVNDNAAAKISPRSLVDLALGAARSARVVNYPKYFSHFIHAVRRPWSRALFLDLLLSDLFVQLFRDTKADFASLFLNAGAHIQHHYMFSSSAYKGECKNPDWYIKEDMDPLLDVYELYDAVLGSLQREFPDARIMFATGLHQTPYPKITYYWRLKDHEAFLTKIGAPFQSVEPRMSRDFVVRCASTQEAAIAAQKIGAARAHDGTPLFEVDNRGDSLFVMLTYPAEITKGFGISVDNQFYDHFDKDVAFVAIKNGEHIGTGYFGDSGSKANKETDEFPLRNIPKIINAAFA